MRYPSPLVLLALLFPALLFACGSPGTVLLKAPPSLDGDPSEADSGQDSDSDGWEAERTPDGDFADSEAESPLDGDSAEEAETEPERDRDYDRETEEEPLAVPRVVAVSAGNEHACALDDSGTAYCWGSQENGQIGTFQSSDLWNYTLCRDDLGNTSPCKEYPFEVKSLKNQLRSISAGSYYSCATSNYGTLYCWGANDFGQSGVYPNTYGGPSSTPHGIDQTTAEMAIVVTGERHTCALTTEGAVYCWGDNSYFQLGAGTEADCQSSPSSPFFSCSWNPLPVPGLERDVIEITAGDFHSCARKRDNRIVCWGRNDSGQLGDGTTSGGPPREIERRFFADKAVTKIDAGGAASCAVTADGALYCWGDTYMNLGNVADAAQRCTRDGHAVYCHKTPAKLYDYGIRDVAVGKRHACALGDGERYGIFCFGDGHNPCTTFDAACNLGWPKMALENVPANLVQLAAGKDFGCAISGGGALYCWLDAGDNRYGKLGNGGFEISRTPVRVQFL